MWMSLVDPCGALKSRFNPSYEINWHGKYCPNFYFLIWNKLAREILSQLLLNSEWHTTLSWSMRKNRLRLVTTIEFNMFLHNKKSNSFMSLWLERILRQWLFLIVKLWCEWIAKVCLSCQLKPTAWKPPLSQQHRISYF